MEGRVYASNLQKKYETSMRPCLLKCFITLSAALPRTMKVCLCWLVTGSPRLILMSYDSWYYLSLRSCLCAALPLVKKSPLLNNKARVTKLKVVAFCVNSVLEV